MSFLARQIRFSDLAFLSIDFHPCEMLIGDNTTVLLRALRDILHGT